MKSDINRTYGYRTKCLCAGVTKFVTQFNLSLTTSSQNRATTFIKTMHFNFTHNKSLNVTQISVCVVPYISFFNLVTFIWITMLCAFFLHEFYFGHEGKQGSRFFCVYAFSVVAYKNRNRLLPMVSFEIDAH